ncbi:MAG: DUF6452 family protein [Bacteroidetes bacterium]|nr:DUF6452 family protein [Bacteroidota bacterium]
MIKKIIASVLFIIVFASCTRDDICSEDTATTPLLLIEFRDITNRLEIKAVTSLRVLVNDSDTIEAFLGTSDTLIAIPLNTRATISEFLFIKNSGDSINTNTDIISFTYSTQDIYVNRACAFKTVYNGLGVAVEPEVGNENWIRDFIILNDTIANENEAHLTIFH